VVERLRVSDHVGFFLLYFGVGRREVISAAVLFL
jgi:hypothetical protein